MTIVAASPWPIRRRAIPALSSTKGGTDGEVTKMAAPTKLRWRGRASESLSPVLVHRKASLPTNDGWSTSLQLLEHQCASCNYSDANMDAKSMTSELSPPRMPFSRLAGLLYVPGLEPPTFLLGSH